MGRALLGIANTYAIAVSASNNAVANSLQQVVEIKMILILL
jgi:hypothetical protein